jgi:N4-(beta-N-acetylglucosaminyl)-L-asparaginase
MSVSRRDFLATAAVSSLSLGLQAEEKTGATVNHTDDVKPGKLPVIICASNGLNYLDDAYAFLQTGGDTLDAALRVVKGPEDDPNDTSVGLGGLPNEEGVVELDACCMHGPTRRAGSVGGVRNIKNVSLVSKAVMEHTGHVMLVGEGAERFAVAMGFPRENLLTDHSRKVWLLWKEYHSSDDWWGPGMADPHWKAPEVPGSQSELWQERVRRLQEMAAEIGIEPERQLAAVRKVLYAPTGTIHCSAANEKGEVSGCTTTSGLAFKLPGRVGDSPIIGAGCFTDPDVGSAGATGSGEENIKIAGAHTIIENMRRGMSPQQAGMDALERLAHLYNNDKTRLRYIQMVYYILRNDGAYAGVSFWSQSYTGKRMQFAVHDGKARLEDTTALFEGPYIEWPPVPKLQ